MVNHPLLIRRDRLFRAIGATVVEFQFVELWVAEALTGLLQLKVLEDRHVVLAAMSYKQKVDLLCELFPRKRKHEQGVAMTVARGALYSAEEYRNKIVHSVWAVEGDKGWVRTKGSIKRKDGFALATDGANLRALEAGVVALKMIRDWELLDEKRLRHATKFLRART